MVEQTAILWERLDVADTPVRCHLCAHRCVILAGHRGICQVRANRNGTLVTLVYGQTIAAHVDPIEKKPLFHFYPGSRAFSVATPGCNFHCTFCQNWEISQSPRLQVDFDGGQFAPPAEIAAAAVRGGCLSVAYTYTEPTVFAEYALDTARLAHASGLQNIFVSNGYMTGELLAEMAGLIDGINVDLKAGRGEFYRRLSGAALEPVLANLKTIQRLGIWLEVTTLVIPGHNDADAELRWVAEYLFNELGPDVPWHVSRFHPDYRLLDAAPTPPATLERAWHLGRDVGLRYVYVGNLPGHHAEHTLCPGCGAVVIERSGYQIRRNALTASHCAACATPIAGRGLS
jgi:pyruvate formate lyase activating enzyme